MARRSRTITDTIKQEFRVWRIAIYIRLSKEDARNNDESESVSNQRAIIEEHIASFNDGLYCAFSRRIIVSRRTPTFSASCFCVRSFICRYFFNLHSNSAISYSSPSSAWSSWSYRYSKYSERKIPKANERERVIIERQA